MTLSRAIIGVSAMLATSCASDERCSGTVIVLALGPKFEPLCAAAVSEVSGADRIPVETEATCKAAFPVRVDGDPVTVEISAIGHETQTLKLDPPCDPSGGCKVVVLAELPTR